MATEGAGHSPSAVRVVRRTNHAPQANPPAHSLDGLDVSRLIGIGLHLAPKPAHQTPHEVTLALPGVPPDSLYDHIRWDHLSPVRHQYEQQSELEPCQPARFLACDINRPGGRIEAD